MVRVAAVDFGTTSSVVAYVEGAAQAELLQHGTTTRVPSAVFWDRGHLLAGAAAVNAAARSPESFEPTPKRQISSGETVLPFDEPVAVERAVAEVLKVAAGELARREGVQWVATHPAAWSSGPLAVLRAAFAAAEIEVVTWVPEPVAAAWRVIPDDRRVTGGRYAVFDWGGGTFDAAVLRWDGSQFRVDAHDGDDRLGGEDIDDALLAHVLERLPEGVAARLRSPSEPADLHARQLLRRDVQEVKHSLSRAGSAPLTVVDRVSGEQRLVVSRDDLDELAAPFVERCVAVLSRCLSEAGAALADLSGVFLTGDASRLTLTATRLREEYPGLELQLPVDAKGVVALGAADLVASLPEDGRGGGVITGAVDERDAIAAAPAPGNGSMPAPHTDSEARDASSHLPALVIVERPELVGDLAGVTALLAGSGVDQWNGSSGVSISSRNGRSLNVAWHQLSRAHPVDGVPIDLVPARSATGTSPQQAVLGDDDGERVAAVVNGDDFTAVIDVSGGSRSERRRILDANLHEAARTWFDTVRGGAEIRWPGDEDGAVSAWSTVRWGFESRVWGKPRRFVVVAAANVRVGEDVGHSDEAALAEAAVTFGVPARDWSEVDEGEVVVPAGRATVRGFRQRNKLVVVGEVVVSDGPATRVWAGLIDGSAQSMSPVRACEPLLRTVVKVSGPGTNDAPSGGPSVRPGGSAGEGPIAGGTPGSGAGGGDRVVTSGRHTGVPPDRALPSRDELNKRYTKDGLSALAPQFGVRLPSKATKNQMLDAFDEVRHAGARVLRYEHPDLAPLAKAWPAGVRRSAQVLAEPETVEELVRTHLVKQVGAKAALMTGTDPLRLEFHSPFGWRRNAHRRHATAPAVTHAVTILRAGEASHVVWDAGWPTATWLERRRFNSPAIRQVVSDRVAGLVEWLVRTAPNTAPPPQPPPPAPPPQPPPPAPPRRSS